MNNDVIPESVPVPLSALIRLGVEHWRLAKSLTEDASVPTSAAARHALRKMQECLQQLELTVHTLDGHPFDVGLAARVVDRVLDASLSQEKIVIEETVSPLVMWRGQVVKSADIVTRQGSINDG